MGDDPMALKGMEGALKDYYYYYYYERRLAAQPAQGRHQGPTMHLQID